jgi:hypothetical protein
MKNILLYDRLSIPESNLIAFEEWNLDIVASISQAINHPFLRLQETNPLLFVVHANAQTGEFSDFVGYIKRFWPALSVVLIPDEQHDPETWHRMLKTFGIRVLDQSTNQGQHRLSFISSSLHT